jgi:large subunit ribosomal protein L22
MSQQFKASVQFARIAPRKLRYVVDQVRGKSLNDAYHILRLSPRRGARVVFKLLRSAYANAEHVSSEKSLDINLNRLKVAKIWVDEGPTMKRWRARAMGRANQILKRSSHVTLILEEAGEDEFRPKKKATKKEKKAAAEAKKQKKSAVDPKAEAATETPVEETPAEAPKAEAEVPADEKVNESPAEETPSADEASAEPSDEAKKEEE